MELDWKKAEDLNAPFTVSSNKFFASAMQDGSFGEDSGFWLPPVKILDELQFTQGGEFFETDRINVKPSYVELNGSLNGASAKQTWFCPQDKPACVIQFESELDSVNIEVEASFLKATSPTRTEKGITEWEKSEDSIHVYNKEEEYHTSIICKESINFDKDSEKARFKSGNLIIVVSGSLKSKEDAKKTARDVLENWESYFEEKQKYISSLLKDRTQLVSPDENLNKTFSWAKIATDMLYHEGDIGGGYFAGLPQFPNFFGRDTVWSVLGINAYGDFEEVRKSLDSLGKLQAEDFGRCKLPGEIPHEFSVDGEEVHYNSSDASLLWIKGVHDYVKWTGDLDYLEKNYEKIKKAVEWGFEKDENDDLLIEHYMELFSESPLFLIDTTWMDTKVRWKSAIDVQAIWCECLKCASELCDMIGYEDVSKKYTRAADELEEKINELYWNEDENYFHDTKGLLRMGGSTTSNPIIPVLFDIAEEEKKKHVLEKIGSEEFTTPWGVRSVSEEDFFYIPGGFTILSYHQGKVWPLITGWCCAAEYMNHKPDLAKRHLDSFKDLTEKASPGVIPETVRGDRPEPADCYHQLWSSAMLIYDIVCGLFGVKPNSPENFLKVEPHIPETWDFAKLENLRVGDNEINMEFQRTEFGWKVIMESDKELDVELSLPVNAQTVELDGEDTEFESKEISRCRHSLVSFKVDGEVTLSFYQ